MNIFLTVGFKCCFIFIFTVVSLWCHRDRLKITLFNSATLNIMISFSKCKNEIWLLYGWQNCVMSTSTIKVVTYMLIALKPFLQFWHCFIQLMASVHYLLIENSLEIVIYVWNNVHFFVLLFTRKWKQISDCWHVRSNTCAEFKLD